MPCGIWGIAIQHIAIWGNAVQGTAGLARNRPKQKNNVTKCMNLLWPPIAYVFSNSLNCTFYICLETHDTEKHNIWGTAVQGTAVLGIPVLGVAIQVTAVWGTAGLGHSGPTPKDSAFLISLFLANSTSFLPNPLQPKQ